ncbi:MAG: cytochrome c [Dehalococcoidia bacterium]
MTAAIRATSALVILAGVLIGGTACRRARGEPPADPVTEVFQRHDQEEGLTRVQTDGKRLFAHYCATCHGEAGEGDGQNAYNLDPQPPNFRESLKEHEPSYWRQIIEGGSAAVGRSPQCPPRGRTVAAGDIDALVAYLEVLGTPRPPTPPAPSAPPAR